MTYNYTDWGPWGCDHRKLLKFSIALEQQQNPQYPRLQSKLTAVTSGSLRKQWGTWRGAVGGRPVQEIQGKAAVGAFQGPHHPEPLKGVREAGDESEREKFLFTSHKENLKIPSSRL